MMDQVAQALTSGNTNNVTGAGQFAVAPTGAIAWLRGDVTPYPDRTLASVDRHGQVSPLAAPVRSYFGALRRSPDGKRLAVAVRSLSGVSLWIWDSDTGQLAPRVLDGECLWPIWSPDGQRIAFEWWKDGSASTASISADAPTSSPVLLTKGMPASFTPDGQLVALRGSDIVVVNVQADQARVESQSKTPETERNPQVSPNGRWLAYGSDISGRFEIWVMPYPTGAPTQVGEGESAAWNPDGRELFFLSPVDSSGRQRMMAAGFAPGSPRPTLGRPHPLFEFDSKAMMMVCAPLRCYDVAPDGQHFYVVQSPASFFLTPVVTHINLITNWFEELKAKVPVKR
jgi:dipeptidyl aminopeptidase/acylaminoacyl peptidase